MKNVFLVALLTLSLVACEGPAGPMGPPGEPGPRGEAALSEEPSIPRVPPEEWVLIEQTMEDLNQPSSGLHFIRDNRITPTSFRALYVKTTFYELEWKWVPNLSEYGWIRASSSPIAIAYKPIDSSWLSLAIGEGLLYIEGELTRIVCSLCGQWTYSYRIQVREVQEGLEESTEYDVVPSLIIAVSP